MKELKITIGGMPGAGKTTIAEILAKKLNLNLENRSFGRILAEKRKITINELMEQAKTNSQIHKDIDKEIINYGKENKNFILSSWLAYKFIPDSFKIFLYVSPKIGAKRIYKNQRPEEIKYSSIKETQHKTKKRLLDTKQGFEKAYKINFLLKSNYDLVINTTRKSKKQVIKDIIKEMEKRNII
ncbi:AAA family ATPase [archaeon]|jgi:CMP/dCMP kinase|nr:AAA family ATPase [archaeon]